MSKPLLGVFVLIFRGDVCANPSTSVPSGLPFHTERAEGKENLEPAWPTRLQEGRSPSFPCQIWHSQVSGTPLKPPAAETPPGPQALCSQASPSFLTKNFILSSSQRNPLHLILSLRMGRIEHFPSASALLTDRPPCPHFQWSVLNCSLLPALPVLSCLRASHGHRTRCLGKCCPTAEVPHLWWGPGACAGARLPAPVDILGKEQLLQQSQWDTGCPGCALHVNWAVLQLMAVTQRTLMSLLQNASTLWRLMDTQLPRNSLAGLLRESHLCHFPSAQPELQSKGLSQT